MGYNNVFFVITAVAIMNIVGAALKRDRPCLASGPPGKLVCVCNATYCDEITRDRPPESHYVSYTTSKDGLRFYKDTGILQGTSDTSPTITVIEIDLGKVDQTIEGFGGSITDAAGLNWKSLQNPMLKKYLIESYFSSIGIEYNLLRMPIGGTDFSTRKYALNESPLHDTALTNYTLAPEDYAYKFPMYEEAKAVATSELRVVASCWAPPDWMKNANEYSSCGTLKPEHYTTYANYHLKFIEQYEKEGIPVWAITTTNEPTNYLFSGININCLQWSAYDMGNFIANHLGPTIRTSKYNKTKIFALDDQRYTIASMFIEGTHSHPGMLRYVDGLALHSYWDDRTPVSMFNLVRVPYPNLTLLVTEFCEGFRATDNPKVDLGSWDRAVSYLKRYFENLNNGNTGFIDWNLCLDKNGGPNWALNLVDAPIIVFPEREEFVKQPMFYAIGHFSKFVPRGSRRVSLNVVPALGHEFLSTAFVTPRDTVVVVLYNGLNDTSAALKLGDQVAVIKTPCESIVTVEIPTKNKKTVNRSGNATPGMRRNQPKKSSNKSLPRNPFYKTPNSPNTRV